MKNFKRFITKAILLVALLYVTRIAFQFPVEYFGLDMFTQSNSNKVFSKIDGIKILVVVGLFFALYFKQRINLISHPGFRIRSIFYILVAQFSVALYYGIRFINNYFDLNEGILLFLIISMKFIMLCIAFGFFVLGVFQYSYLRTFFTNFKKELSFAGICSVILYNMLIFFQKQWFFFSELISLILYSSLDKFYNVIYYFSKGAPVIQINDFAVSIGSPCSGIDSMLLFVAFSASLFALDHKQLNKKVSILFFIIGFVGVYFVNVLRLLMLILVGVHISPDLAVGLFHTNAGWIFFLIYFFIYYLIMKRFVYRVVEDRR